MIQLALLGISHNTAPVDVREKFAVGSHALEEALGILKEKPEIAECIILSTCNRSEIYAITDDIETCFNSIRDFIKSFSKASSDDLNNYFYTLTNVQAVKHLYRVTSSLDSMVVGEPQILGQVKDSYKSAHKHGSLGVVLHRLFQTAFFVAKKIRTETNIGSQAVSVSYLAVELAKRIFDELGNRSVLLIGTGEMSELAARNLIKTRIKDIFVVSRNYDNAVSLSDKLGAKPMKHEEIYYNLKDVDIVITATGSNDFIIKSEHVAQAMKLRRNEPMFFIDIAVPRDIDPRVNELSGVYLYDVDDLQDVLDQNLNSRKESTEKAELIIDRFKNSYIGWLNSLKVFPTIIDLRKKADLIKSNELKKALAKMDDLNERDKQVIENLVNRITSKILHDPITNLKKEASTSLGAIYSETLKSLYGLDKSLEIVEDIEDEIEDWN